MEIIEDTESAEKAVEVLRRESVVGFDTKPVRVEGQRDQTALVQIASRSHVFLFRIEQLGGISPLIPLLKKGATIKTGPGIRLHEDIKNVEQWGKNWSRSSVNI